LADADGLDHDHVEGRRQRRGGRPGGGGQPAQPVAGGGGADEHCAVARIDVSNHAGAHPRVGAVDVAPIVHLDRESRGAACADSK